MYTRALVRLTRVAFKTRTRARILTHACVYGYAGDIPVNFEGNLNALYHIYIYSGASYGCILYNAYACVLMRIYV